MELCSRSDRKPTRLILVNMLETMGGLLHFNKPHVIR